MATVEELQEKLERMKAKLKERISASKDPSLDRDVRMARKKVKRIQRRLRSILAKQGKAKAGVKGEPSKDSPAQKATEGA